MQRSISILCLLIVFCASLVAQNNTSSPYSRYGYGELSDNVPGAMRAMGGVGIGMRDKRVINPSQPASYSVVDSTTFMFDVGASAMWSNYGDALGKRNKANGNLEYLTIQFPIWKYIGFSVGVLPYSFVGYDITQTDTTAVHPWTKSFVGEGGITEVYGGLSFNIMNWVALGANIYYMFGNVTNDRTIVFSESDFHNVYQTGSMKVSDIRFRYGLQFFHNFEHHSFVIGGVFENKSKLNGSFMQIEATTLDTVMNQTDGFDLPMMYGVGVSYVYDNRLTLAFDYSNTIWSKANYALDPNPLQDRMKLSLGFEYRHNQFGKKYVERMPFRFGLSMADPYVCSVTTQKEFTVSIGVGFPLRQAATVINTSLEYGHRGDKYSLEENYLRFTINAAIAENWFFKRRL